MAYYVDLLGHLNFESIKGVSEEMRKETCHGHRLEPYGTPMHSILRMHGDWQVSIGGC